ncbi:MAG: hypothetical protein NTZ52_00390 [Chlamydiae bacterium]|nr:hypothetical protein [Chlamydiota bacterium]
MNWKTLLHILLCCLLWSFSDPDDEENPALFHHVNVVTGSLHLSVQDAVVAGAKNLNIPRTYTSLGALEKDRKDTDLRLKNIKNGFIIQGGWSLFPQTHAFITCPRATRNYTVYIAGEGGSMTPYVFAKTDGAHHVILRPKRSEGKGFGKLSGKSNQNQNYFRLNEKKGRGRLHLPDGSVLHYTGDPFVIRGNAAEREPAFYTLDEEDLPSGHKNIYSYDKKDRLKEIRCTNPKKDKTFSSIRMHLDHPHSPYKFSVETSDGQEIMYYFQETSQRDYLQCVKNKKGIAQEFDYVKNRKGIGARVQEIRLNGLSECRVSYHLPKNKKEEEKWRHHPKKKNISADKVSTIEGPLRVDGTRVVLAQFSYCEGMTTAIDVEDLVTRFYHDQGHLTKIEYYNASEQVASTTQFLWDKGNMIAKIKLDQKQYPLFAKTFSYDLAGNVIKETFWGDITGTQQGLFHLNPDGSIEHAESYTKSFSYHPARNLLLKEEEESGLSYEYHYQENTDLLTKKIIRYQGAIFAREFLFYDQDHLLYKKVSDDGIGLSYEDVTGLTGRKIQQYMLHPQNGLIEEVAEFYLDIDSHQEILLSRIEKKYSPKKQLIEEALYDSDNQYRYTVYTEYDHMGNVAKKITPLGQENTYLYDPFGSRIQSKEVGSLEKKWTYDAMGRCLQEEEIDNEGISRCTSFLYDAKGRLLSKTDPQGNTTHQAYDYQGRCVVSTLPQVEDEHGVMYEPRILYDYDRYGNLSSTTTPRDETTHTEYTSLRKPVCITHPDGGQTRHVYGKNETLHSTTHPDGTTVYFAYDYLKRMTEKRVLSADSELLTEEHWTYNPLHLLSHTNSLGLTTYYKYDDAGRLIEERAEEHSKTYAYDTLGFRQKTTDHQTSYIELHDVAGRVIKQWIEDERGHQENIMEFIYDEENRKVEIGRHTSQGVATDHLMYDTQGRLSSHTDPLGYTHQFTLYERQNTLDQTVLEKKTINPLGLIQIETFDTQKRCRQRIQLDPEGQQTLREDFFYDKGGNKSRQVSSGCQDLSSNQEHVITWDYDACGRVIAETEAESKTTYYEYDLKGRIVQKTLPSGTSFLYDYDGLDRLVSQKSTDGSIDYRYHYGKGMAPIYLEDLISSSFLQRDYDLCGHLIQEISSEGLRYLWEYDPLGRCTCLTLPDLSRIIYTYSSLHMESVTRQTKNGHIVTHRYNSFDPTGHVSEETYLDGTVARTEHDLLERVLHQSSPYYQASVTYGPSGLITQAFHSLTSTIDYEYDALQQLTKEGDRPHAFTSHGNPKEAKISPYNELVEYKGYELTYDGDGRMIQKSSPERTTEYQYDALGRLTQIYDNDEKKVEFFYDPLSRLIGKKTEESLQRFLYNQETEIGCLDGCGSIKELKILGLGLKADVGGSVAIELAGEFFIPLHDLRGNIIALASMDGVTQALQPIDAFGQNMIENKDDPCPWRFSSKRSIEGLICFGLRFYDPEMGRWITPDPMGYADGVNVYAYLLNSPTNRLDLFGLFGEPFPSDFQVHMEVPVHLFRSNNINPFREVQALKGSINGVDVDWLIKGGDFSKLSFSAEELQQGKINLFNHFHEIIPEEGKIVGFLSFQNGIQTSFEENKYVMNRLSEFVPNDSLILSLYNPSNTLLSDLTQSCHEMANTKETVMTALTRQYFTAASTILFNINPEALWVHIAHSRGGGIATRAVEGMSAHQLGMMKKNFLYLGIAPSVPMSNNHALQAVNIYSDQDLVTGWMGKKFMHNPSYIIEFVTCQLPKHKWIPSSLRIDHALLGPTYQKNSAFHLGEIHRTLGQQNETHR